MAEYINNKNFYNLILEYKEKCKSADEDDLPVPKIPDKIGECFIMIATKLATKGNFVGYTYTDEMICDALENCVIAIHSFNPEKSKNPFAYFTQIIWYAFLRRIEKEKKQTYVKYKSLEHLMIELNMSEEDKDTYSNFDIENEKMIPIIEKFEKSKAKKLKKKIGLERYIKE